MSLFPLLRVVLATAPQVCLSAFQGTMPAHKLCHPLSKYLLSPCHEPIMGLGGGGGLARRVSIQTLEFFDVNKR